MISSKITASERPVTGCDTCDNGCMCEGQTPGCGHFACWGVVSDELANSCPSALPLVTYLNRRFNQDTYLAHREGAGFDLVYRLAADGTVTAWSELYGWHESAFHNLNACDEYDQVHFADHLVLVSVAQLPAGAR